MKKFIIASFLILLLAGASSASIRIQTQANTMGMGLGAGLSMPVIPILMDLGVEVTSATNPWSYSAEGSYVDEATKQTVNYDGTLSWQGTRYGIFLKLNLPFISPIIRAGAQQATISVDGDIHAVGISGALDEDATLTGSYVSLGLPFYIGPVYIEPSFGTQSLYIPHYLNEKSIIDFQLAFGLSIL